MATVEIRILQPRDYYLPGMWIEGVVLLQTVEPIKARAVRLQFYGEEFTRFKVGDDHRSETHELINAYVTLWGLPKSCNKDTPKISSGSYAFPYCVQVPANEALPSSYEDAVSHVRYMLKAYIDIPFAVDVEWKSPIRIVSPRVLTDELQTIVEQEACNDVGCCCPEGVVDGRVRLERSGVHVGELLRFTAQLANRTKRVVTGWRMTVRTVCTHGANAYTNCEKHEHLEAQYGIVLEPGETFNNLACLQPAQSGLAPDVRDETFKMLGPKENETYSSTPFSILVDVPADFAVNLNGKLIRTEHQLVFRAIVDGACTNDFSLCFPIRICNTPLCFPPPTTSLFAPQVTRTGVHLAAASRGEFTPLFSFDGLDYDPEDQFNANKAVSYPVFYDEHKLLPPQLRAFCPAVYHLLLDGVMPLSVTPEIVLHTPSSLSEPDESNANVCPSAPLSRSGSTKRPPPL